MDAQLRMGRMEWALLIGLAAIWGTSFLFYKILVASLPPLTIAFGRVGLAAVALHIVLLLRGERLDATRRDWFWFLVCGVMNNAAPFTLIAFGETQVSAGLASILNATIPIFGILAAHWLTRDERLTGPKLAGVGLGFIGVAVLIGPGLFKKGLFGNGNIEGELSCLAAAVIYAFGGVFSRRLSGMAPLRIATGQITASAIFLLPLVLVFNRPWTLPMPAFSTWLSLLAIALGCTALAYVMYFRIMVVAGATNMMLVTFLVPVSAISLGAILLHEHLGIGAMAGMMLIGAGLACIDGRLFRLRRLRAAKV